jgi:hypothetical protein
VDDERETEGTKRDAPMIFRCAMLPLSTDANISRRTFIKGTAAAVGAVVLAGSLAGCDGNDETTTTSASTTTTTEPPTTTTTTEPPTTTTDGGPATTDPSTQGGGVICTCEAVCSCDGHCSCDGQGQTGGHYWYPT